MHGDKLVERDVSIRPRRWARGNLPHLSCLRRLHKNSTRKDAERAQVPTTKVVAPPRLLFDFSFFDHDGNFARNALPDVVVGRPGPN